MNAALSPKRRLFFALWPDASIRQAMDAARNILPESAGRRIPMSNLHLTLVFLGAVSDETAHCAQQIALRLPQQPAFTLVLDQLGSWRTPQVAWLAPSIVPTPLLSLVNALQRGLQACAFTPEDREFKAHVTVLRDLRGRIAAQQFEPITWKINRFCLMESLSVGAGSQYQIVQSWPLGE